MANSVKVQVEGRNPFAHFYTGIWTTGAGIVITIMSLVMMLVIAVTWVLKAVVFLAEAILRAAGMLLQIILSPFWLTADKFLQKSGRRGFVHQSGSHWNVSLSRDGFRKVA